VPVPGRPAGKRARGFDHAHEIARVLAGITGRELVGALGRAPVRAQVGLARGERRANAAGSVTVRPGVPEGGRAILVDDVYTTGATLDACALGLLGAGAGEVVAACFARTLAPRPVDT
jgi:predicted amidophosphoribosyltransferase